VQLWLLHGTHDPAAVIFSQIQPLLLLLLLQAIKVFRVSPSARPRGSKKSPPAAQSTRNTFYSYAVGQ
jgi:hypothetical protein